jgi:hypothetical protein
MPKHEPVVHRSDLRDIDAAIRDPRIAALLADGWTIAADWIQTDERGPGLCLLFVPPKSAPVVIPEYPPLGWMLVGLAFGVVGVVAMIAASGGV